MTSHTRLYHQRLSKVIDYIYQNLDQPLDLNRLADIACMSSYHWHRIYRGIYGETLANTVRRLRLHKAAGELVNSDKSIIDIAKQSGYASVQSFNRVFAEHYHLPPATYRQQGSHQALQSIILQWQQGADTMNELANPEVKINTIDSFDLIAVPHQGSYMNIGNAFEKLYGWIGMNQLFAQMKKSVGIYLDDPNSIEESQLKSFACAEIVDSKSLELSHGLERKTISSGKYAVLQHKGPYSDMQTAYNWFYGAWLAQSEYEVDDKPCFEVYLNNPREVAATELLTDIYMPLK